MTWTTKKLRKDNKESNNLLEHIEDESKKLDGRGQLDGLHNLVKQNVYLSKIYVGLMLSVKDLNKSTTHLTVVVIILMIVGIILTLIQIFCK